MSNLHTLSTPQEAVRWLRSRVTGTLRTDSRQVQPGDGFIAWPGGVTDGRAFVASALERGAVACLVEQDGVDALALQGDAVAAYPGLKAATGASFASAVWPGAASVAGSRFGRTLRMRVTGGASEPLRLRLK